MLKHPHLVAWLTLVTGFVTLCALVVGTVSGLRWFLFSSPVPLTTRLVVSQGSIRLQMPNGDQVGVYQSQIVQPQTTVIVNDNAQGILSFIDPYSGQSIADFTLTTGTQLTLDSTSRPRFEWSHLNYAITLTNAQGQMIVSAPTQGRAFQAEIDTYAGNAYLDNYGHYTISTDQSARGSPQLHVLNQGGDARIALPDGQPQKVWPSKIMNTDRDQYTILESASPYTTLASGLFYSTPITATPLPDSGQQALAAQMPVGSSNAVDSSGWLCSSTADNTSEPPGQWRRTANFENGALHFWRTGSRLNHAETSCRITPVNQNTNTPARANAWADVTAYKSIRLNVRFKLEAHDPNAPGLNVQDLPVCGEIGTECPLMLEIAYSSDPNNPDGSIQYWHHGFYALADPGSPLTCDTCRVAHERISPDVWYFYDSGNVNLQIQVPGNPLLIKSIRVYASGHQYDVAIGEVTLLGSVLSSTTTTLD